MGFNASARRLCGAMGHSPVLFALLMFNTTVVAFDIVLWTRFLKTMKSYSWFTSQFLYPASVAVCGTVENWLQTVGGIILSGPTATILMKIGIVPLMLLSYAIVKTTYTRWHYAGAAVVVLASVVQVLPDFESAPPVGFSKFLLGLVLYLLMSFVPKNVLEEKYTKQYDMDVWFFRAWEAIIQVCIGGLLVPLAFVKVGDQSAIQPNQFGTYMSFAFRCFLGDKSAAAMDPSNVLEGQCESPWMVWIFFTCANVLHDVSSIAIAKYSSAAMGSLWGSTSVILTIFLMQFPELSGQPRQPISFYTLGSVLLIVAGLWMYGRYPEEQRQRELSLDRRTSKSLGQSLLEPASTADEFDYRTTSTEMVSDEHRS